MEDILAIILIFGGATAVGLSFSPLGRAFAERIRYGRQTLPPVEVDESLYEEVDRLRLEVGELHERVDFTERLLAERTGPHERIGRRADNGGT